LKLIRYISDAGGTKGMFFFDGKRHMEGSMDNPHFCSSGGPSFDIQHKTDLLFAPVCGTNYENEMYISS
jgi:hypothetical protein